MIELWGGPLDGHQREPNVNEIRVPIVLPIKGVHGYVPESALDGRWGVYRLALLMTWRQLPCGVRSTWTRKVY